MRYAPLLALILLAAAPLAAGIVDNLDGTHSFYFCNTAEDVAYLQDAIDAYELEPVIHGLSMWRMDQETAIITDQSGNCGGAKHEWKITVPSAQAGPWRTAITDANGYVDVDPADGVDDSTGLTRDQTLDQMLKKAVKEFAQREATAQGVAATDTVDDFTDN